MSYRNGSASHHERKKHNQQDMTSIPLTSSMPYSSSTSTLRNPRGASFDPRRTSSPPASAYFPLLEENNARTMVPHDAEAHFAYSTQLRRHQTELSALRSPADFAAAVNARATSFWSRIFDTVTGRKEEREDLEDRRPAYSALEQESKGETLSAKFAHCSIQVCTHTLLLIYSTPEAVKIGYHCIF